jgi:hypothetical protein
MAAAIGIAIRMLRSHPARIRTQASSKAIPFFHDFARPKYETNALDITKGDEKNDLR